jgi:DNA-binding NarL/FixJ family response regulator
MSAKIKVLIVEDDELYAKLVMQSLLAVQPPVFRATWIDRLAGAVERLAEQNFNIILLDLGLPDSKGLDTLGAVKSVAGDTPIVVLSGWQDDEAAIRAIEFGAQEYLFKEAVSPDSLVRAMKHALHRHCDAKDTSSGDSSSKARDSAMKIQGATDALLSTKLTFEQNESVILIREQSEELLRNVDAPTNVD